MQSKDFMSSSLHSIKSPPPIPLPPNHKIVYAKVQNISGFLPPTIKTRLTLFLSKDLQTSEDRTTFRSSWFVLCGTV